MKNRLPGSASLLCMVLAWAGMGGIGALGAGLGAGPDAASISGTDPTKVTASKDPQTVKFIGTNLQGVARVVLTDSANNDVQAALGAHDANQLTVSATLNKSGQLKATAKDQADAALASFSFAVADASADESPAAGSEGVPVPTIRSIVPAAPLILPNEPLVLNGSGFKDGVVVTFTDGAGHSYEGTVLTPINEDRLVVTQTLGIAGKWTVTAANLDANKAKGKASDPLPFAVANGPQPGFLSPGFIAFVVCALVSTALLWVSTSFVLKEIKGAQKDGWSLQEALSEESIYQPKVITQKKDVITYASTSRVIAVVGLMGILTIVVGVGYSIIWNLTMFETVPDLSQVRMYLYGAACLFAPYLANQLSSVFTPSAKTQAADGASATSVTGVVPAQPKMDAANPQLLSITGSGFNQGLSLTLINPLNTEKEVAAGDIAAVSPTLVTAKVKLDTPGPWKVVVANAGASPTAPFDISVIGPPTVSGVNPAAAPGTIKMDATNAQKIVLTGSGFVSELTVQLTPPGGGAALTPTVIDFAPQQVSVSAVLGTQGQWQAVATNPGNQPSAACTFTVAP